MNLKTTQIKVPKHFCASFILIFFNFFLINAQTTIINSATNGGFESGTTFATNGWTTVGGTSTDNIWFCGTGATAGFSGTRCAYISNTAGGTYSYDIANSRASFMYRNITIPAGEDNITLSLRWIGRGQASQDKMRIWIVPTTYTPISGTAITASGTAPTGNIRVGATNYSGQATWTTSSFKLPQVYAGQTVRLVFEWTNDASLGTQPPVAIDNISLISATTPLCSTPIAQPTALVLNSSSGTINGSFTAASPTPTNYLVVYNTTGVTPTPVDGTVYTVGGTIGAGNIVGDIDTDTNFSVSGLTAMTNYYFFVFSYQYINGTCNPNYFVTTPPLTGNLTTNVVYCNPISSATTQFITGFSTTGGTYDIVHTPSTSSPNGYSDLYPSKTLGASSGATINFTENFYASSPHGFRIWIDYNKDGDFADAGELEFTSAFTAMNHSGSFTINAVATGDYRMRIRAWDANNDPDPCTTIALGQAVDFKLTILPVLPCSGNPSNITASAITASTATISWTAATPAPTSGYQISVTTASGLPVSIGTHTTGAGVTTINVSSLPQESTLYVYVRSNCGANQGYWVGPIQFTTPCTTGPGTGVSSAGCPTVIAGGIGMNGSDPAPITCATTNCVDLEADYLRLGNTDSYTVESIPYAPPYHYGCLTNAVSVNTDDVFSPLINLPFNFCYYGNSYNTCVIGSNGVISFDTTLANQPSGYTFNNNLPNIGSASEKLFPNTIYGVYHDIDPSVGGTVGWELVTLSSGCRALVAGWRDVPMFSDNSILYTGMTVLYENTNIIEVYIKEKKIDNNNSSPWNNGNAIVGIQNVGATTATVAPGRNGLDPNWEATNEAWRFVPSGNDTTSLTWYQGAGTTGPIVGTTDVINVCPSTTTTYTAEVTYNLSCGLGTIKVSDQTTVTVSSSKTWTGATNTDWNTASNWTPAGVPTITTAVIIPNTVNKPIINSPNMAACNITVQNGGLLTAATGSSIVVDYFVDINTGGTFIVKNDASLIQVNNVSNTVNGTFTYERTATNIKGSDYIYWSSPVENQDLSTIYTTPTQGPKYLWNTTAVNPRGGLGIWNGASGTMTTAKGYIIRGSSNYGMAATNINATFTGAPNNGNITIAALRGAMQPTNVGASLTYSATGLSAWDDNWNLVGNPYPSAINALQFLSTNSTELAGNIRLWRHLNAPALIPSPFYQNFMYNYNSSDYLTINFTGPTTPGASDIIKTGQAFMIQRKEGVQDLTGVTVNFNNAMRRDGTTILNNGSFFRNGNDIVNNIEKHRIWLDIVDNTNRTSETTLLGYVEGATSGWDDNYDATIGLTTNIGIYSFANDEKCIIQGRPTPFNINDEVPLGINVHSNGSYHIAIKAVDGLFSDNYQTIYLEDKQQNIVHNLLTSPYTFTSNEGTFNNRFVLRYTETALNNNNFDLENSIKVYATDHIKVKSTVEKIKEIIVYDVIGKKLIDKTNVNTNEITINELKPTTNVLLVKVTLENGTIITKKVIY
ncbi:MAG: T9SS sorting signal type C domain-containing protein [Limnohabitans sp.]|nr:T9SS sorting signal type C domain-containing protein [Limnohabitans sp.]